jgi:Flp pilus assembly protein TadD
MLLPLGLAYALAGRLNPVIRIFVGYAALVILGGIAVTVSRGSWASTCLAMLLFFVAMMFQRIHRLPALLLLVLLVGAVAFYLPKSFFVQGRLQQLVTDTGKVNDDLRFSLWAPAYRMWGENPWCGVGPAHFDARFRAYRPEEVQLTPDRAHNDYLNTLADWGAIGFALVASAWVLLAWGVAKTWRYVGRSSPDLGGRAGSNKFAFVLGASLGLVAILAHSFVDFNMHIPANAILCVSLMALLSSHLRFATDNYWHRLRLWNRSLATLVLLVAGACLAREGWRQGAEFVWLERAGRASSYSPAQVALLQRAYAVEPMNAQTTFALGDALRHQSQEGGESYQGQEGMDYRKLAEQAMTWFSRGMKLNPWDSRNFAGYGWCLDWLDRAGESGPYFNKAEALDPNNYFNLNNIGQHYMETGDFAAARPWFERSLRLQWHDNPIARSYLAIANERMQEAATNEISAQILFPPR